MQIFGVWLKAAAIVKNSVASEREGNWNLYVATVEDCIQWQSLLNVIVSTICIMGQGIMNITRSLISLTLKSIDVFLWANGLLRIVQGGSVLFGGDMKVEQTIQRVSKGP